MENVSVALEVTRSVYCLTYCFISIQRKTIRNRLDGGLRNMRPVLSLILKCSF